MFDIKLLAAGLEGLIGYRQTTNPAAPQVMEALLASESGLYVNDRLPALFTSANLAAALPADYTAPPDTDYGAGLTGQLNYGLDAALSSARTWMASALLTGPRLAGRAHTVQKDLSLYEGLGSAFDGITKAGRFCGIELRPHGSAELAIEITRIGLQTMGANETGLLIYLYHESRAAPLARYEVAAPLNGWGGGFAWATLPAGTFVLRPGGDESTYPPGGAFYIGYYEDDLAGQLANRAAPIIKANCGTCDPINNARAAAWAGLFTARAVRLGNEYTADREALPLYRLSFPADTNNGLNLAVTARCDLTPLLIRNKYLLAPLYQVAAAVELLLLLMSSPTVNPSANSAQARAGLMLYGDPNTKRGGMLAERDTLAAALSLDLTGAQPPCIGPPEVVEYSSGAV